MNATDQLKNNGISIIGDLQRSSEKTIIILGAARGGTSLCSKVLNELGVFLGKDSRPPVYEDIPLSHALEKRDLTAAKSLVEEYNQLHKIWGFKRPTINANISDLHKIARNPVYIVIFRDILAIAKRNSLCTGMDIFTTMQQSLNEYGKIIQFIESNDAPAIFISYEKALADKDSIVNELVTFLHIEKHTTKEQIENAKKSIQASPDEYLNNTNEIEYYGYLDNANLLTFSGWAVVDRFKSNAQLELHINNKFIYTFAANEYREDIKNKEMHSTGYCGFDRPYPSSVCPKFGDIISIKFKDTDNNLRGSPLSL